MRLLSRRSKMAMTAATAALVLAAPSSVAAAGPTAVSGTAAALSCTTWSPDPSWYDPSEGSVTKSTAPLRPGPYADCGTRETLRNGYGLVVYCYYRNTLGNTWFYVNSYPNWTRGWIFEGNVSVSGLVYPC
jgi:hypothetical protein